MRPTWVHLKGHVSQQRLFYFRAGGVGRGVFYQYYQGFCGIAQTLCFSLVTTYLKMSTLAAITKGFAGTQELQTHLLQLDYETVETLKLTCL